MKKKIICSILLLVVSASLFAQSTVKRFSASAVASSCDIRDYTYHYTDLDNPKSKTITSQRSLRENVTGAYLDHMRSLIGSMESGNRRGYDYNAIPTLILPYRDTITEDYINRIDIAREIVEFWFSKKRGSDAMNCDVVFERGEYAASDQDVLLANSSQLGYAMVKEKGWELIDESYLEVITLTALEMYEDKRTVERYNPETKTTQKVTEKKQSYNAYYLSRLFKLNFDETTREKVFNAWENDEKFNRIPFTMTLERSESTKVNSEESFSDAVSKIGCDLLTCEKVRIQNANRGIPVFNVNPISAKIGTKEGLSNVNRRYKVYKFVENANGDLKKRYVGFTRLSKIARNEQVATGKTSNLSTWVHVGGYPKVKAGMEMKERRGGNFGLAPYYGIGGLTTEGLTMEVAVGWNLWKPQIYGAHYLLLDFGLTPTHFRKIAFYDLTFGYGFGLNLSRFVEIRPYAKIGLDILGGVSKGVRSAYTHLVGDRYEQDAISQFALAAGADVNFQICYPLYLFVRADYSAAFGKSQLYKDIRYYDNTHGPGGILNHGNGLGLKAGIRIVL